MLPKSKWARQRYILCKAYVEQSAIHTSLLMSTKWFNLHYVHSEIFKSEHNAYNGAFMFLKMSKCKSNIIYKQMASERSEHNRNMQQLHHFDFGITRYC